MGRCLTGEEMAAYVEGALSEARQREVEDHMKGCASCAEEASSLRAVQELLAGQTCPSLDVLMSFTLGEMEENGAGQVRAHVARCARCREAVEAARDALAAEVEPAAVSAALEERLASRLQGEVRVRLSEVPLEEEAPLTLRRELGELELELQFAGKYSGLSVAVGVRERLTGRPVLGVAVRLASEDGRERVEAVTDEAGVARLALRTRRPSRYSVELLTEDPQMLRVDLHG